MDCICSKHAVQAIQRQAEASTVFLVNTLKRQFLYKNTSNFDVDSFFFFGLLFVVEPVSRVSLFVTWPNCRQPIKEFKLCPLFV